MENTVVATETSLASKVRELVASDSVQLPPLPAVAVKAREMLASENFQTSALGELLGQDAAIVASLLRLANSAAFGGLGRVENLSSAMQRIGFRQVGAIVTGLCLKGHFEHPSPEKRALLEVLWDHTVTSAFAARSIASRIGVDGERAFLSGLLHDCGKVLVLRAVDHLEEEVLDYPVTEDLVRELMEVLHAELGHRVLTDWNLPEEVCEVALNHGRRGAKGDDLMLCVKAANLITRRLGFHLDPDPELTVAEDPIIEDLGLDDLTIATLMVDMEDHLSEMKNLF